MSNSRASLHLKQQQQQKKWVWHLSLERKESHTTGRMTKHPLSNATWKQGVRAAMLRKSQPSRGACFPNASSNRLSFGLTFVKPLLLLRVNLSALKMACSFYPLSLIEMWTVRATPFHKESCQGSQPQFDFSSWGKKKKSSFWKLHKQWLCYRHFTSQK